MTSDDTNPLYTALEAIRAAVDGGSRTLIGQTVSAEINQVGHRPGTEILLHAIEATTEAALLAAECCKRAAAAEGRTPREVYDSLRESFGGLAGE